MLPSFRIFLLSLFTLLALFFYSTPTQAWGCKGHQTVALLAEKHLTPEAQQLIQTLLSQNPVDPQLKRYCGDAAHDLLADAATWPDDVRNQLKNGPWHYINIPRGTAPRPPLSQFCPSEGCVTKAIADQVLILKDTSADPRKRADAIRYIVHFVGDLHMPLHAISNNDEGGTCVPVRFFRRTPRKHQGSFSPNLHSIWDSAILERDMEGADPAEYADLLDQAFKLEEPVWQKEGIHIDDWAWESHEISEAIVYPQLAPAIPVEAPVTVHSCTDANNIGERMMQLHEFAGQAYQDVAAPIIQQRIAQAGIRLALILNDAAR
jgi:hypothetical protein